MNTGYMIYQAERPKSAREQREIDTGNARLVASIARMWGRLARPTRPQRQCSAAEDMTNREIAQPCSLPSSREKLSAALEL